MKKIWIGWNILRLKKKKAKDIKGVHYMSKSYAEKRFGTADVDDLRKIYEIIKK